MRTNRLRFLFFLCLISIINPSSADPGCRNANVLSGKLITDICWDCVFPIIIAGVPMNTGQFDVPQASSSNPLCTCSDDLGVQRPGVTMAMWQPFQLIEFERVPGCASALNGVKFPADRLFRGLMAQVKMVVQKNPSCTTTSTVFLFSQCSTCFQIMGAL